MPTRVHFCMVPLAKCPGTTSWEVLGCWNGVGSTIKGESTLPTPTKTSSSDLPQQTCLGDGGNARRAGGHPEASPPRVAMCPLGARHLPTGQSVLLETRGDSTWVEAGVHGAGHWP